MVVVEDRLAEIELMERVGRSLALSKCPLGFIQSSGFNSHFVAPEGVENYITYWKERALKHYKVPVVVLNNSKYKVFVDLITTVYLQTRGMVYVSYTKNVDNESYQGDELVNKVYTLDLGIIQACVEEIGKNILKATEDAQTGLKQFVEAGELPGVVATYNQNMIFKFTNPRKKLNFNEVEYSVVPLPFLQGYVDGLKELMKDNLVVIDARTLMGNMREFSITSHLGIVEDVYGFDNSKLEMFSILRSKFGINYYNQYPVVVGLHNANFKVYELGMPNDDYPQRQINMLRLASVKVLDNEEERRKQISILKRYAEVDFDAVVDVVETIVSKWELVDMSKFLQDTIVRMKVSLGDKNAKSKIEVFGRADFILKFRRTIDSYSTGYLRAVVDYVLAHPVEFNGFTGTRVTSSNVMRHIERVAPVNSKSTVKYDEVNPFVDFSVETFDFAIVDDNEV